MLHPMDGGSKLKHDEYLQQRKGPLASSIHYRYTTEVANEYWATTIHMAYRIIEECVGITSIFATGSGLTITGPQPSC